MAPIVATGAVARVERRAPPAVIDRRRPTGRDRSAMTNRQ
ncbi:hypothetical protein C7S15_3868 [Burkholderia cepacia]|nr:hypothetical protein [Burkholderia cepacia]